MIHVFIINPAAGASDSTDKLRNEIEAVFSSRDEQYYVFITERLFHAMEITRLMRDLFRDEVIRFYACGGRGLVTEVISAFDDFKQVEFAFYPIGFVNEVIHGFGKKSEQFKSIVALVDGEPQMVNAMRLNEWTVLDFASIGFRAYLVEQGRKYARLSILSKNLPFIIALFKSLFQKVSRDYSIEIDGKYYDARYSFLIVSNNFISDSVPVVSQATRYDDSYRDIISPEININDGTINLRLFKARNWLSAVRMVLNLGKGNIRKHSKATTSVNGNTVKISHRDGSNMVVGFNGEFIVMNELNVSVVHQAFAFIVPKDAALTESKVRF